MLSAVRGCGAGSQARGRFQYGSAVAVVVALAIALAQGLMTLSAQSSRRQTADRVCADGALDGFPAGRHHDSN
jgi:hypothetical protein